MIKKIMIVIIAAFLLVPFFSNGDVSAAEQGSLAGIDYKRIYTDEKSNFYPATINFGGVKLKGKLKWKGKVEGELLDEYIMDFIEEVGIDTNDLVTAQHCYDEYLKIDEVKDGYIEKVIARIAGVFVDGFCAAVIVDAGSALIRGEWDFYSDEQWRTAMGMFSDPISVADYIISIVLGNVEKVGKHPVFKALMIAKNTAMVSYAGYQDDLERWETRVNGVNASRALEEFYKQLNEYLRDKDPNADWVLNFNGKTTRRFTFMGVSGNKQTWEVYINLVKEQDFSANHGSPAGAYEGVASIELTHDMSRFSNRIWNLKLGRLKKNWYDSCDSLYLNGKKVFDCSNSGGISIYRFLCSTNAKVYIYTDRLATASYLGGSGTIMTSMYYGNFEDYQTLDSDRKAAANTAVGFTNEGDDSQVVGYVIADVAYHLEANGNDSFTIIQDKGSAEVGLLFNQTKVNDGTKEIVTFFDKNIWAPLKSKKATIIITSN